MPITWERPEWLSFEDVKASLEAVPLVGIPAVHEVGGLWAQSESQDLVWALASILCSDWYSQVCVGDPVRAASILSLVVRAATLRPEAETVRQLGDMLAKDACDSAGDSAADCDSSRDTRETRDTLGTRCAPSKRLEVLDEAVRNIQSGQAVSAWVDALHRVELRRPDLLLRVAVPLAALADALPERGLIRRFMLRIADTIGTSGRPVDADLARMAWTASRRPDSDVLELLGQTFSRPAYHGVKDAQMRGFLAGKLTQLAADGAGESQIRSLVDLVLHPPFVSVLDDEPATAVSLIEHTCFFIRAEPDPGHIRRLTGFLKELATSASVADAVRVLTSAATILHRTGKWRGVEISLGGLERFMMESPLEVE